MQLKPTYTIAELSKILGIPNCKLRYRLKSLNVPMVKMSRCYLVLLTELQKVEGLVESIQLAEKLNQEVEQQSSLLDQIKALVP